MKMIKIIFFTLASVSISNSYAQSVSLGQGISASIQSVRSWEIFDAKIPFEGSHEH
jgi:hypothetical protein